MRQEKRRIGRDGCNRGGRKEKRTLTSPVRQATRGQVRPWHAKARSDGRGRRRGRRQTTGKTLADGRGRIRFSRQRGVVRSGQMRTGHGRRQTAGAGASTGKERATRRRLEQYTNEYQRTPRDNDGQRHRKLWRHES